MKHKLFISTLLLTAITLTGCTQKSTTPQINTELNNNTESSQITEEQAKEAALDKVPGATLENILEYKTESDNNRLVYDVKIHYDQKEYDFEIDAYTGAILEWDVEDM